MRQKIAPSISMVLAALLEILLLFSSGLRAQDEERIKQFFEGKLVILKLNMPATKYGVDIYPDRKQPLHYDRHAKRLYREGISIHYGESVKITKIKAKDKHIEVQLDGGGYGTFGDDMGVVLPRIAPKTKREKDLEKAVKKESDADRKKSLKAELEQVCQERHRTQEIMDQQAEILKAQQEPIIREKARRAGSRFNIRYERALTPELLTPDAIKTALSDYLEFLP